MKRYTSDIFVLMFMLLAFSKIAFNQSCPTGAELGTLESIHIIPPIYAKAGGLNIGGDIDQHFLHLSTTETIPFDVVIQNADGANGVPGGISEIVTISKTAPAMINLSAAPYGTADFGAMNIVTDTDLNLANTTDGLVLTSTSRYYASIRHQSNSQGGALISKGQAALGKRFRSGHMHMDATGSPNKKSHFISVMASEDNTTVYFNDISPGVTFVGGNPDSVSLNKYESYVLGVRMDLDGNDTTPNDLNGTLITSNNAIAVNTGSFLGGSIPATGNRDIGMDQILPTVFNGTQFILTKGAATTNADVLETPIVVADIDNTQIFLRGETIPVATINAGEYHIISGHEYPANGAMFIRTSNPAAVFQTTNSNNLNGNGLNYVAAILPNLELQGMVISNIDQLGAPTIGIIAPVMAIVTVDGTDLTGGVAVPGINNFVLYSVVGKTGDVEVISTEPYFLSITTLSGVRGSAGFFVGFPNSYAVTDVVTILPDSTINIDVQANDVPGIYTWTVDSLCNAPTNGLAVINPDGTIKYTPGVGFNGVDTFFYFVGNGLGLIDMAMIVVAVDNDGDGIGNFDDLDIDNDGIPNVDEMANALNNGDTDGDGINDEFDLDSDNDGVYDFVESGHGQPDTNNDGRVDGFTGTNGLFDELETVSESGIINYTVLNTDSDANANYIDLDSDGDGIPDNIEAQTTLAYEMPGAIIDANGLLVDYPFGLTPVNTDSTDNPDYLDLNSDNDAFLDSQESGLILFGIIGSNGLDNGVETTDDFSDANGNINSPDTDLADTEGDCCTLPMVHDLDFRDPILPEDCTNGFDDDLDGLVDCADPDCGFSNDCCNPPVLSIQPDN